MQAVYYLTLYKPRSEDPTETEVLEPAAGAPHSDEFKVCSMEGVVGFKPYFQLDGFVSADGSYDSLLRRVTVGDWQIDIADIRVGGVNEDLWVTAFCGNANGINHFSGCKALLELSTDGGGSKSTIATLRVHGVKMVGKKILRLSLRNAVNSLQSDIFVSTPAPSVSYAFRPPLLPVGRGSNAYGPAPTTPAIGAKVNAPDPDQRSLTLVIVDRLTLVEDSQPPSRDLFITKEFRAALDRLNANRAAGDPTDYPDYLRVRVVGIGQFKLRGVNEEAEPDIPTSLVLDELDSDDPYYAAYDTAGLEDEASVSVEVIPGRALPISEDYPLLIKDVPIGTFTADIAAGLFSDLRVDGTPIRSYPYDADEFEDMALGTGNWAGKPALPKFRGLITGAEEMGSFIEEQLCPLGRFGYRTDEENQIVPFDTRLPSSLPGGIKTITDDDLDAEVPEEWDVDDQSAITELDVTYFIDDFKTVSEWGGLDMDPPPGLMRSTEAGKIVSFFGSSDLDGVLPRRLTLIGLRGTVGGEVTNGRIRSAYAEAEIDAMAEELRPTHSRGTTTIALTLRLTANTAVVMGELVLLNINALPNPGTNSRGGTRLARVVGLQRRGIRRIVRFEDCGTNVVASVPAIGTIELEDGNPSGIKVPVTLGAAAAEVWVAITDDSEMAAPAMDSELWRMAARITQSQDVFIRRLPRGKRAWPAARSTSFGENVFELPSAFVFPVAPAYLDLPALTAPSSIGFANVTGSGFIITFEPGELTLPTTIEIDPPVNGESLFTVPAGGKQLTVSGALADTEYDAELYHLDGNGGQSASATDSVTTDALAADEYDPPYNLNPVVGYPVTVSGMPAATLQVWLLCPEVPAGVKVALYEDIETDVGAGTFVGYGLKERKDPVSGYWTQFNGNGSGIFLDESITHYTPFAWGDPVYLLLQPELTRKYKARFELEDGTPVSDFSDEIVLAPPTGDVGPPELPPEAGGVGDTADYDAGALLTGTGDVGFGAVAPVEAGRVLVDAGPGLPPDYFFIDNVNVSPVAAIDWSKISKAGSSLADLTTRSASDLSSGTLPVARVPGAVLAMISYGM